MQNIDELQSSQLRFLLEPEEQKRILGCIQQEVEVNLSNEDELVEQGTTEIGEFEKRARLAFRKANLRSEILDEEPVSIVMPDSISQDPIVQSVLQGIIFDHFDDIGNTFEEIKQNLGSLKLEYETLEEYKESWFQYLLFYFGSHLTQSTERFSDQETYEYDAELILD